jgi:copper chaperone CopZ
MQGHRRSFIAALALAPLTLSTLMASEPTVTAVFVKDMHCQTCAKKIAVKLYGVPGVVKVSTNVKKGVAVIVPQASKHPSPKAIWEAVEAAKFEPVRIASPLGNYTEKPQL